MATNLGRKIIRQVTARRFAGGTGGNLMLRSGLPVARPKARSRHSFNEPSSNNGSPFLTAAFEVFHGLPDVRVCIALVGGFWWLTKAMEEDSSLEASSSKASASKATKEFNAAMTKPLEEKGVSRELCEAKIAKIKQNIESGSASDNERYHLRIYEGWLQLFTRGE